MGKQEDRFTQTFMVNFFQKQEDFWVEQIHNKFKDYEFQLQDNLTY